MLNEIWRLIFKVIFFLLRWLSNLILLPFTPVLNLFPLFSDYLPDTLNFFDTYIFPSIRFCKEVFINLTGFPQEIITLSVEMVLTLVGITTTLKAITFLINMWKKFKGGGEA